MKACSSLLVKNKNKSSVQETEKILHNEIKNTIKLRQLLPV